jgi:hypothetical protein
MQRIALDTIRPMDIAIAFRYIIVVFETFTRYVELFPANDVTAAAAADTSAGSERPLKSSWIRDPNS